MAVVLLAVMGYVVVATVFGSCLGRIIAFGDCEFDR